MMNELEDKHADMALRQLSRIRCCLSRRYIHDLIAGAGERSLWIWSALEAGVPMLPVEVLLVPLTRRAPDMAMRFVILAAAFSGVGAVYSYAMGHLVQGYLSWDDSFIASSLFGRLINALGQWGESLVFLAALLPLPLFIFSLAAGLLHVGLLPFLATVVIGRALRFYLVTSLTIHFNRH